MAAVAAPVMGPVSDAVISTLGDSILVELGLHAGFEISTKIANDLIIDKSIKRAIPIHSKRLETTGIKVLLITLKYKHTVEDAALGFYRSSVHKDSSLFATVKDYLSIEKGWFSPYLFASGRRPIIPRTIKPDVIFCHGPFLSGDYRVGETLLAESASTITFCDAPPPLPEVATEKKPFSLSLPKLSNVFDRSRTPSPEPAVTLLPPPPVPRRMVILVVGLKPHRKLWTTSARPCESVINYILLNGCPAIVVPVKVGAPVVAWDGLTLEQLWKVELPDEDVERSTSGKFEGIVDVLFEYLDFCVDWERVTLSEGLGNDENPDTKGMLKDALALLVAAGIRSGTSKEVQKEMDKERGGIAMWRIP